MLLIRPIYNVSICILVFFSIPVTAYFGYPLPGDGRSWKLPKKLPVYN